jgi:Sec-independent protein translocase protein TatA
MAILGAAALLFFGPEQLPRVARKAGNVMREIQNTSQSFIRELERAADIQDVAEAKPPDPAAAYDPVPYDAAAYDTQTYDEAPTVAMPAMEPPAPDPERPSGVAEKLAEPRPAPGLAEPESPSNGAAASPSAEAPPEADHPAHL